MGHYMVVRTGLVRISVLLVGLFLLMQVLGGAAGQSDFVMSEANGTAGNVSYSRLSLDVYLDQTGKALVTGYANADKGLTFLQDSQYSFENDTGQLYALTNSLTWKSGDLWRVQLAAEGYYDEYAVTFYLPADSKLGNINRTEGLQHLISASNDSFIISVQGFEVIDPFTSIEYRQALQETAVSRDSSPEYLLLGLLLILGVVGVAALIRHRGARQPPIGEEGAGFRVEPSEHLAGEEQATIGKPLDVAGPGQIDVPFKSEQAASAHSVQNASGSLAGLAEEVSVSDERGPEMPVELEGLTAQGGPEVGDGGAEDEIGGEEALEFGRMPGSREDRAPAVGPEKLEITSEMAAVMETLTPRERKVIKAVIDSNGRITQAEIRYQTGIPKSSLTGILLSLERRKLITKRGWGRTNVVELSDWFKSQKTGS